MLLGLELEKVLDEEFELLIEFHMLPQCQRIDLIMQYSTFESYSYSQTHTLVIQSVSENEQ